MFSEVLLYYHQINTILLALVSQSITYQMVHFHLIYVFKFHNFIFSGDTVFFKVIKHIFNNNNLIFLYIYYIFNNFNKNNFTPSKFSNRTTWTSLLLLLVSIETKYTSNPCLNNLKLTFKFPVSFKTFGLLKPMLPFNSIHLILIGCVYSYL